jgi:nucleotide-binding universal stress UspA family protein
MRVLLCTDGSFEAAQAVRFGARLARGLAGTVELLGVIEDQSRDAKAIAAALETLGAELNAIGVSYATQVRRGHAAEQILDETEEWQADLVVIGQLGRRGLTRFILGGTATRIVQYADCSVLLVRGQRVSVQKVLVCTAGGEPGLRDVALAGQVAAPTQATVTVLHVMSQVALTEKGYRPDLDALADELIARRTPEGLHLQAALSTLQALGVKGRAKVRHGLVVDEIVAETREGDYDLLAIGAHMAQGLSRWLLDDVTRHLLEAIQRPVLVVRD